MDNIIQYISYVTKNKKFTNDEKYITPFEKQLLQIYDNYVYTPLLNYNNNTIININDIIPQIQEFINTTKIAKLIFSEGSIIYVETIYLKKTEFFNNMLSDTHNDGNLIDIKLLDILDNYVLMDIIIKILENIDNNDLLNTKFRMIYDIIVVIDYLGYNNENGGNLYLQYIFNIFEKYNDSLCDLNMTLEELNYFSNVMIKHNFYSHGSLLWNIMKCNDKQLFNTYGSNVILSSAFFKNSVLEIRGSSQYVIEYRYYEYFEDIASYENIEILFDILLTDYPENIVDIMKNLLCVIDEINVGVKLLPYTNKITEELFLVLFDFLPTEVLLELIKKYDRFDLVNNISCINIPSKIILSEFKFKFKHNI